MRQYRCRFLGLRIAKKKGYPCSNDAGFIVERDPDTVRGPDLTFYEDASVAADIPRAYTDDLPRLGVDVMSPGDTYGKMMRRVRQMLAAGVPLFWIVDPEARNVTVHRPGKEPYVVEENEEITGEDVLPDFRCKVADFFRLPGEQQPQ